MRVQWRSVTVQTSKADFINVPLWIGGCILYERRGSVRMACNLGILEVEGGGGRN